MAGAACASSATPAQLAEAVASARREAASAFGDGTVFCERYVERARHIEVQIMADDDGQRRHVRRARVLDPAPAPEDHRGDAVAGGLADHARASSATPRSRSRSAVGYVGAGTVEFLVAPSGEFFFLEMNTRLQVEHAITECVVGMLDLVRLQILVAEGGALPFDGAPPLRGHAIEARLYAEDPALAWLPSTGTLHRFHVPGVAAEFRPLMAPGPAARLRRRRTAPWSACTTTRCWPR